MTNRDSELVTRAEARLGTVLRGKYRLDAVLGVGGMAVVYKATHRNQAQFAVKMLHPEVSLSADIRARFLREGYAANSIKHPGAVLVVDDDVAEDGSAFLVMELLDGIGCEDAWERSGQRLSSGAASAILIQLLDVLGAAHANGIVHRDIKPANLFLMRNGVVKVLDFGIARAREAMASEGTGTGMTLGTPAFMAPEQAMGKSREIDGRTDLWAAGATFFSLVSGQCVHVAENAQELVIKAATQPARLLSTVVPYVSPALAAVIDRALAFRREDRWETAAAMRDALMREESLGAATPEAILAPLASGGVAPPVAPTMPSGAAVQVTALEKRPVQSGLTAALTSSSPMSSEQGGIAPVRSRRWALWAGAALALGITAGVYIVRLKFHPVVPPPRLVTDTIPASSSGPAGSRDPVLDTQVSLVAPPVVAPAAQPPPTQVTAPLPIPAAASSTRSSRPAPKPLKDETKSASPDCVLNYTLDDQGRKHFKPECFLKK